MKPLVWASTLCLLEAAAAAAAGQHSTADNAPSLLTPSLTGRDNFTAYCSPCHGRDGTGNGPVASALRTRPANLSTLALRAGGTFPAARVEAFIRNGGANVAAHGSSEMPIWGTTFMALEPSDKRAAIRIANVVSYLETLQVK